ncbi:hypothetical protein C1H46_028755 [Malus baccata]|uniref:Uncharacterized protein n=1 Tax=Malus baccata TaxID=106549 RepID=A0A540LGU8_MALBA|nr:hypothetical protein C1H46_028755 [Malus baccata]
MVIIDAQPEKLNSRSNSISDPNTSQSLAFILNNPNASDASSASVAQPEFAPLVPRSAFDSKEKSDVDSIGGQGEALVACFREGKFSEEGERGRGGEGEADREEEESEEVEDGAEVRQEGWRGGRAVVNAEKEPRRLG